MNEWDPLLQTKNTSSNSIFTTRGKAAASWRRHIQGRAPSESVFEGSNGEYEADETTVNGNHGNVEARKTVSWKQLVLVPILLLLFIAVGINFYIIIEYTHRVIQDNEYKNRTANSTFSACDANTSDPDYKTNQRIQQKTAEWQIYFSLAQDIPALVAINLLGSFSDRLGRKMLFMIPLVCMVIKFILSCIVIYFSLDFTYFLIGFFIEGMTGHSNTIIAASYSYVADITEAKQERTFYLTVVETSLFLSICISSVVGGYFIQYAGFFVPMVTTTGQLFLSLLFVLIFLPESYSPESKTNRLAFSETLNKCLEFFMCRFEGSYRVGYLILFTGIFFASMAGDSRRTLETLYQLGHPFCWSASMIGFFAAARHGAQGVFGMAAVKLLQKGLSDENIAILGAASNAGSFVLEGLAKTDWILYMVPIPATFAYMILPMLRGILSKMTPTDRQGAMFASVGALNVISSLIASVSSNSIYSATLPIFNGFVFFVLAGYCLLVLLSLLIYKCVRAKGKRNFTTDDP